MIHAAGESSPGNLGDGTHAIALCVPDESALLAVERRLVAAGLPHKAIRECMGAHAGQLMAIGVAPMDKEVPRRLLSSLPLLK